MAPDRSDRDELAGARLRPIIGREAEIATVMGLVREEQARLIVLTGPAGVGKSFLALHCALRLEQQFAAGCRVIPLDAVSDPGHVLATIAYRLGVAEGGRRPIAEELEQTLQAQELLLVIDTFEHVLPAAPALARVLERCPQVRAIVTSRSRLGIAMEDVFPVEPLPVPLVPESDSEQGTTAIVMSAPAAQLFIRGAQAVRPEFTPTDHDAADIARICRSLDGIPLAIELAAAWEKFLTTRAIASRLTASLSLLKHGARDLPPRLRTMRSALQWSYDLLDPDEQRLFRALSYLPGSWSFELVEVVAPPGPAETTWQHFASLVEKSMVQREAPHRGPPRYRLLGIVREYGHELLTAHGEVDEIGARHASWALAEAVAAGPELMGPEQLRWLARLDAEYEQLAQAFDWFQARHDATRSLRLAISLWRYAFARGRISEARLWLDAALLDETVPDALLGEGLFAAGYLAAVQGDLPEAASYARRGLAVAMEHGDRYLEGLALLDLSFVELLHDRIEQAGDHVGQALDALASVRGRRDFGEGLIYLGDLRQRQGKLHEAAGFYLRALALFREIDETQAITWATIALGRNAVERGNPRRASILLRTALARGGHRADRLRIIESLEGLAAVAVATHQPERAVTLIGAADAMRAESRMPPAPFDQTRRMTTTVAARRALGNRFRDAWMLGRQMTLAQAIAFALAPAPEPGAVARRPGTRLHELAVRHRLTHREQDVLQELAMGKPDREIARALSITERTVQVHVTHIFDKLGVRSRGAVMQIVAHADALPPQK